MKASLGIQIAVLALVTVLGFFAGRRSADWGGAGSTEDAAVLAREAEARRAARDAGGGPAGSRRSSQGSPEARIRNVVRELQFSPMVMMDFEAMFSAYEAIRDMSPEEVQAALRELDSTDASQEMKMVLQMLLINRWAKSDGPGAVEFALEQENPQLKMMAMMGGLTGWIREDPDGAYAWYEQNRDSLGSGMMGGRQGLDGMLFNALAQRDMGGAFDRLETLDHRGQLAALNSIAGSVGGDAEKREQFLHELAGIEDESLRQEAMKSMVRTMAWQNPQEAIAFMESQEWSEEERKALETNIALSWSNVDPEGALEWQTSNREGGQDNVQVATAFGNWVQSDPEKAAEWLAQQPEEVHSDTLYQQASQNLRWSQDYERSIEYAQRIADGDARTNTVREIYRDWQKRDEGEAQEWLNGLDQETQQAILTPVPQPPVGGQ